MTPDALMTAGWKQVGDGWKSPRNGIVLPSRIALDCERLHRLADSFQEWLSGQSIEGARK